MTHDYGGRPRRKGVDPKLIVGGVLLSLFVVGMVATLWTMARDKAVAHAQAWTVAGPPCPSLPLSALARLPNPPQTAFYDYDVHFVRGSGAVSCDEIKDDGGRGMSDVPVCKFNSPDALEIRTASADVAFGPRLYSGVVVSVIHGQPSCVIVPHDRLKDVMAEF